MAPGVRPWEEGRGGLKVLGIEWYRESRGWNGRDCGELEVGGQNGKGMVDGNRQRERRGLAPYKMVG